MIEIVYTFLFLVWFLIVIIWLMPKKKRLYKRYIKTTRRKNKQKKSTQPQQKTYQTTYYDFNPLPYNPQQQKIVKDFYKDYGNFDPIKPKVKNTIYDNLLHTDDWKSKRDKILKRDNYTCRYCGKTDCVLQVHHKYYNVYPNGTKPKPWDYPDDALITLCDDCHKRVHQNTNIKTYYRKKYLHYYN